MGSRIALPFRDRAEAGRALARELTGEEDVVVVGLARGGVAVAAALAEALGAPLDALPVRKIGHPLQPEYALGAVAAGGAPYLRAREDLSDAELARVTAAAMAEADALAGTLRRDPLGPDVAGRTCVLVDDGLATGASMVAAVRWARERAARRVVVAVPVGARESVRELTAEADAVICLASPWPFRAVGAWYERFDQIDDEAVIDLLAAGARRIGTAGSGGEG